MKEKHMTCVSTWRKGDKKCRIYGTKTENDIGPFYTFAIRGWNPLPCASFRGTYHILADWLIANGWEREISNSPYLPDAIHYFR